MKDTDNVASGKCFVYIGVQKKTSDSQNCVKKCEHFVYRYDKTKRSRVEISLRWQTYIKINEIIHVVQQVME